MASTRRTWGCCKNDLDNNEHFISCKRCHKFYHFLCLSVPEISADSEAYNEWKCTECLSLIQKTSNKDSTPVRNVSTSRGSKRIALNSPPEAKSVTKEDVRDIVQDVIKKELAAMVQTINSTIVSVINRELEPIKNDVKELTESLNFHTGEFDKLQQENMKLKDDIVVLKKENQDLKTVVTDVRQRLGYLEQQSRSSNLEIQCLPENKNENLFTIVKQLGSIAGCALEDKDIMKCTRIAKLQAISTRPRSIVVQFASPRTRDQLLAAVITYNKKNPEVKLNSAVLGLAGNKTPIFVAEHLSPALKALHAATRIKAKQMGYKYVWVRGGRIFVKKNEDAENIIIRSMDTLNKII